MDRKQLGQQKLGVPVMASFEALVDSVDRKSWADFQREPVGYYFNKMIGHWVLRLIDNALSDAQLAAVDSTDVKVLVLSLFRDMFRHNHCLLRPSLKDGKWVEKLFGELGDQLQVPADRLADDGQPYEIEDMAGCDWAKRLGAFGVPGEKLFACHRPQSSAGPGRSSGKAPSDGGNHEFADLRRRPLGGGAVTPSGHQLLTANPSPLARHEVGQLLSPDRTANSTPAGRPCG